MDIEQGKQTFRRSQFAVVLVLASLNGTFERKCLVVPFAPEVLKFGRQTTTRTAAAPENGYFDSRVLSRQHAEVWADRDTGKVWLRDCKSSNGTYINGNRLSAENTESEPQEIKKTDQLDLGIDIVCNDDTKQMYKKISSRVEKISMLPLTVGLSQRQQLQSPQLSRSPSLETLRSVSTQPGSQVANGSSLNGSSFNGRYAEAIFGATTLDALALNHANTTAGGLMIKDSVKGQVDFEQAAKRLVAEIRAVRADTAKIQSVANLLEDIKRAALEAEQQDRIAREKLDKDRKELLRREQERKDRSKSSSLAALKAENARIRAEITHFTRSKGQRSQGLSVSVSSANQRRLPSSLAKSGSPLSPSHLHLTAMPDAKIVQYNVAVLLVTTIVVTVTGVWIMFFFNPPMAPSDQNPFFFDVLFNPV